MRRCAAAHTSGAPTCGPAFRNTRRTPRRRRPNQPRRERPREAAARGRDAARASPTAGRDAGECVDHGRLLDERDQTQTATTPGSHARLPRVGPAEDTPDVDPKRSGHEGCPRLAAGVAPLSPQRPPHEPVRWPRPPGRRRDRRARQARAARALSPADLKPDGKGTPRRSVIGFRRKNRIGARSGCLLTGRGSGCRVQRSRFFRFAVRPSVQHGSAPAAGVSCSEAA